MEGRIDKKKLNSNSETGANHPNKYNAPTTEFRMTDKSLLAGVTRPGRYLGHEYNSVQKEWLQTTVHFAMVFPDLYEIGMSHQGLQILYHIINNEDHMLAERCYCPDLDAEKILCANKRGITCLESTHPLKKFDVIAITLPYELCYTNILTILNVAGIPFYAKERDSSYPLLIGGGAGSFNPEPVADFFDAILLGDGEEAILDIGNLLAELKPDQPGKDDLLNHLSKIAGLYIPSHFQPEYDDRGHIRAVNKISGKKDTVTRRVLKGINRIDHLLHPIVPNAKTIHDRLGIEVARGCTRGCRFCQAGITYRPVREREPQKVLDLARHGIADSGFDELALLSLSTGDYSCLEQTLPSLMDSFADNYVSIAMPSMRVGTLTPTIMDQIKRVRKTGFTLAPEAGSERLRRVINKGITEEDLITTCRDAFSLGWKVIKFYFMIGLPSETDEDIKAIIDLVKKTIIERNKGQAKGKKQINVSVGTFVPKPHTPFQWERQLSERESADTIQQLRNNLPKKGCNFKYHSPKLSYLEGVFSRGDRRLSRLIARAWHDGARLDGWDEHFNLERWQEAAASCKLDLNDYLRRRDPDEILPWHHLQTGVSQQFLKDELVRAKKEAYTPDCRYHGCQKCGLCDFKTLAPVVYNRLGKVAADVDITKNIPAEKRVDMARQKNEEQGHFKYMVHYSRTGGICYLGHLEILQVVFRSLRRAKIVTNFSQGFNPSPKISFSPALPVGTESLAEFFIMDLPVPLKNFAATIADLNRTLPPGLEVFDIELHSGKIAQNILIHYKLTLSRKLTKQEISLIHGFNSAKSYIISKTRKGKSRDIDIRPLVKKIEIDKAGSIHLDLFSISAQPGIKPVEAVQNIINLDPTSEITILKKDWENMDKHNNFTGP